MVRQGTPGHSDKTTETICDTVGANSLLPPYAFHAESVEQNDFLVGNAVLSVPDIDNNSFIRTFLIINPYIVLSQAQ